MSNEGHSAVHMLRCLNPMTHSIHYVPHNNQVAPLQHLCHIAVRRNISVKRFNQISSLGLPVRMEQSLSGLCLNNFLIDPEEVRAEHHQQHTFPATCLIDGSHVLIHLCQTDEPLPDNPSVLASFTCNNITCSISEPTQTLKEFIESAAKTPAPIPESTIWKLLRSIVTAISPLPSDARIDPKFFHIKDEAVFFQAPAAADHHGMQVMNTADAAFYEAPEVLMRQPLGGAQGKVWAVGCIAYELAAKEPAYCDREGSGNLMSVMMGITQGIPPPPIPHPYSKDLIEVLIPGCLNKNPTERISLEDVVALADKDSHEE